VKARAGKKPLGESTPPEEKEAERVTSLTHFKGRISAITQGPTEFEDHSIRRTSRKPLCKETRERKSPLGGLGPVPDTSFGSFVGDRIYTRGRSEKYIGEPEGGRDGSHDRAGIREGGRQETGKRLNTLEKGRNKKKREDNLEKIG